MATAQLLIKILADSTDAQKKLASTAGAAGKFQKGLEKAVVPAAAVGAALAGMGAMAISAASDLQQAQGGVDSVFKGSAGEMHKFAEAAAESAGLSEASYSQMATVIGSQLKNAGTPMDELAGKTNDLILLGADMSAMFGGTSADAVAALSSALKGEMDPIEKYGVSLNAAAINAQMAADGTDKLEGKAATAAKQQAILAIVTAQTADAQGTFAREADTAAGAQAIANAKFKDTAAVLGEVLLPAFTEAVDLLSEFADWAEKNRDALLKAGAAAGILAGAILAINAAMKVYAVVAGIAAGVTKVWTAAVNGATKAALGTRIQLALLAVWQGIQAAASGALSIVNGILAGSFWAVLGPILLIIAAVALLAAGIIWLWNNNEGFKNFVLGAWAAIQAAIAGVWEWIKAAAAATFAFLNAAVQAVVGFFTAAWARIQAAFAAVAAFISAGFTAVANVVAAVWGVIGPLVVAVGNLIKTVFQLVWAVISLGARVFQFIVGTAFAFISFAARQAGNLIRTVFTAVFNFLKAAMGVVGSFFRGIWNGISAAARAVAAVIKSAISAAFNVIRGIANTVGAFIGRIFNTVAGVARTVAGIIKSALGPAFTVVRDIASKALSAIKGFFQPVIDVVNKLAGVLKGAAVDAFNTLKRIASGAMDAIKGAISGLTGIINDITGAIQGLIGWISRIKIPDIPFFGGQSAPATAVSTTAGLAPSAAGVRAAGRAGSAPSGGTVINVNGALDPDAVGRQIVNLLQRQNRRRNGVAIGRVTAIRGWT